MKITKSIGTLLLAIYLILVGLTPLLSLNLGIALSILAIAAGVCLLIGK